MGNLSITSHLIVFTIDKNNINERSLIPAFAEDGDFDEQDCENRSEEIYNETKDIQDELTRVETMVNMLFDIDNFIGTSSEYGDYKSNVMETEFQYVVSIAYIM